MSVNACMDIYNDPYQALREHRNVVMVVQEPGNSSTKGWRTSEVRSDLSSSNRSDTLNSLFLMTELSLTDDYIQWSEAGVGVGQPFTEKDKIASKLRLDLNAGIMQTNFTSGPDELEALYCLAEQIEEACGVRVSNIALLVSWIFTALKALICLVVVIKYRHDNPLVTPGEAVDSFISAPDASTAGMCWAGAPGDKVGKGKKRDAGAREWRGETRKLGCAVPKALWISSYLLFAVFLGIGVGLLAEGSRTQPVTKSSFGPTSQTLGHNLNAGPERSDNMGDIHRALFANLPHLVLALSYFAYNNILTRMLSERELSEIGRKFVPLRVSAPRGSQQGTHRLQLPYMWSIPLIAMSGILHWLLSNCLFPKVNIGYEAYPPYGESIWSGRGLGFSTLAVLITIAICFCAILIPIFIGRKKLSKDMVVFAGNSVVLSAACHVMRLQTAKQEGDVDTALIQRGQARESDIAARKLRWGVVVPYQGGRPGHLSFGVAEQHLGPPQETHYYAGNNN
ncbi:hypothetical protein FIE12Z_3947 [Fusarium flagelliforme]|uniref:Uncharacterized protein n=2 Tax=Fusarium flagelliforme TaxID=2675880 RepID=A0A395MUY1_9HYPO|nr:hypothetical protein FIE12Z_3947 [Fusarium flagelliforme]